MTTTYSNGMTAAQVANLPITIQEEVNALLKAFSRVNVMHRNGEYFTMVGDLLRGDVANDTKFIGTVYQVDVYNDAQRLENFIDQFNCYPDWYKGPRDYAALRARVEAKYNK